MERYDIYDDQQYVTWLQLTHRSSIKASLPLLPPDGPSLFDEFSDILPVDPVPMDYPANHQSSIHTFGDTFMCYTSLQ